MTTKECGTCTKCCEGYLTANIKGHEMFPGKPCFFLEVNKGCTIYLDRPVNPCKSFDCGWKFIDEMPDKFKPEVCGVILHLEENNENEYFAIINAPSEPSAEYLSWAITFARSKNINIVWYVDDRGWWLGNEEFCKQMELKHSSSDPIKK